MKSREEQARVELPEDANLLSLPNELLEIFDFYLVSPKDKAAVAITCDGLHAFFQPKLNKIDAKILIQHIVCGEKEEARKMLEKNPRLLLNEVEVTDEAGRRIRGKAYRFVRVTNSGY